MTENADPPTHRPGADALSSILVLPLTAVGSGRSLSLGQLARPTVLLFHTKDTAAAASAVNTTIRESHPDSAAVAVVHIVDLSSVPRPFRKIAEHSTRSSFEDASANLRTGLDPHDYVIIIPDWDGSMTEVMTFTDVGKVPGVAVLDASGELGGAVQTDEASRPLEWLTALMG